MKKTILFLIIAGVLAAGCVSDTPEGEAPDRLDIPTPPQLAPEPTPHRTPVPPVETVPSPDPTPPPKPAPTPTPTPRNTTSALCDYPPCGRGGSGGGGGGGGSQPDNPICELPTILLSLAGIGVVAICARRRR